VGPGLISDRILGASLVLAVATAVMLLGRVVIVLAT